MGNVVASVCTGAVVASESRKLRLPRALFDVWCLKELVDRYRSSMSSIRQVNGEIVLGDNNTSVKVNERITLPNMLTASLLRRDSTYA